MKIKLILFLFVGLSINSINSMIKTNKIWDPQNTFLARNKLKNCGFDTKLEYIILLKHLLNSNQDHFILKPTIESFLASNHIAYQDDNPPLTLDEICDIITNVSKNPELNTNSDTLNYLINRLNIKNFKVYNLDKFEDLKKLITL